VFAGSFGVLVLLPLADRVGRRPILAITILGYTAATVATAFSRGVFDFAAYQFVARIFLGAEYALAAIVLVETLPAERRGRALGLVSSMSAFGQAGAGIGFLVVVAMGASWRSLYLVGIVPLILVARARRETTFASFLVLNEWKWNLKSINPTYVLVWVVAVSGFFVAGRLMDAVGRRPTAIAFLAGASVAGLIAFHQGTTPGRVLGLGLVIFFLTGSTPCVAAYATELFPPESRGRAGAVLRVANIAGAGVAPALTGLLSDHVGGVGPALSLVGLSYMLAAAVVGALLPETRGREAEAAPT